MAGGDKGTRDDGKDRRLDCSDGGDQGAEVLPQTLRLPELYIICAHMNGNSGEVRAVCELLEEGGMDLVDGGTGDGEGYSTGNRNMADMGGPEDEHLGFLG